MTVGINFQKAVVRSRDSAFSPHAFGRLERTAPRHPIFDSGDRDREGVLGMRPMENEKPDSASVHHIKRRRNRLRVSRTRVVMGLLLIVALAVFISLANKAVQENAEAIRQSFGR
jgi:hypothetical protein